LGAAWTFKGGFSGSESMIFGCSTGSHFVMDPGPDPSQNAPATTIPSVKADVAI